ncbi:hypothetical protein [Eggerthella guodeyinii]|uniref:Uncharacterized protein n=1 Tax=Eggerthella guodeyinii TaxID=2690837 RepID=A0A6N7RKW8_9ACTN|nr:hypothetical protein [Eggerthella guodeyinii]MRX81418.1 hypothetical protein [Eggerthella guodeyinii]
MAKISKMIDDLTGKTEEEMRLKEQLVFLQKMASAKSEIFENRLKRMLSTPEELGELEIVGGRALEYHSGQHVNISQQCDDAVAEEIVEYFKGSPEIKACFQKFVKRGLSGLMGDMSIGEIEKSLVFVCSEDYSIVRVDIIAYKYTFSSRDVLASNVENMLVYTMAKSIVDEKKVELDYLMRFVADMLRGADEDLPLGKTMLFVKSLRETWTMLNQDPARFR